MSDETPRDEWLTSASQNSQNPEEVDETRRADALEVHRLALDRGISVAPGPIFSPRREFRNCLRLNYGHPWTADFERAIATLATLLGS